MRAPHTYQRLEKEDITLPYYRAQIVEHSVPPIPNISHWFKHYIIVDLLNIWSKIRERRDPPRLKRYLRTCFASILRLCSNADPDTLSGLEVTKRMRDWFKRGRHVNPIAMFANRLDRNSDPLLEKYWAQAKGLTTRYSARVRTSSALDGRSYRGLTGKVQAIITSPPYCSAGEYQRRSLRRTMRSTCQRWRPSRCFALDARRSRRTLPVIPDTRCRSEDKAPANSSD